MKRISDLQWRIRKICLKVPVELDRRKLHQLARIKIEKIIVEPDNWPTIWRMWKICLKVPVELDGRKLPPVGGGGEALQVLGGKQGRHVQELFVHLCTATVK